MTFSLLNFWLGQFCFTLLRFTTQFGFELSLVSIRFPNASGQCSESRSLFSYKIHTPFDLTGDQPRPLPERHQLDLLFIHFPVSQPWLLFPLVLLCMSSCLTEKRILRKAHQLTDTTYVTKIVPVVIPRDSVAIRTVTDTSYVKITEKKGRATVTLTRTPKETTATAECDSVIKYVPVTVPCPPQLEIGVNKWWRVAALVLGGLLVISWMSLFMFLLGTRYAKRTGVRL